MQRGLNIELKFLDLIRKKYPSASLIHKYKGYDVWVPELDESVEVKYDPMSNNTGNIVVEIEMFGKPSGLMSTTADYWVFHDDIDFVIMKPMDIVNCIFLNKLKFVEFVGTGDTASKKAFLVPKQLLFSHGKKIEE